MKWIVFVAVAVGIFLVFFTVYAITNLLEKRRRPKTKTLAPDDDPKFLRDLAKKLKDEDAPKPQEPQAPEAPKSEPGESEDENPDDK